MLPREAANKLKISLNATYAAVWTGRLRAEKRDGKWHISGEAVEECLQRRRSRDTAKTTPAESGNLVERERRTATASTPALTRTQA